MVEILLTKAKFLEVESSMHLGEVLVYSQPRWPRRFWVWWYKKRVDEAMRLCIEKLVAVSILRTTAEQIRGRV